jgi:Holliday junction resolvasome RuvABC DNA-binding subunit
MNVRGIIAAIVGWFAAGNAGPFIAYATTVLRQLSLFLTFNTVVTTQTGYAEEERRVTSVGFPTWGTFVGPAAYVMGVFQSISTAVQARFAIYVRRSARLVNYNQPETPLSPAEVVAAIIQSAITETDGRERLRYDGIAGPNADALLAIAGEPLAPGQALELYNRWRAGLAKPGRTYDLEWVKQALAESALKNKYQDAITDLADNFLGAPDYIRMAVRDAFNDTVAARDGTDEDFPEVLAPLLQALGYRKEDAKAAWRAHWDLPSPTQAYEMLHRGLITEDQLADYLRQADYAPRWRPLLEKISYNPITRTDAKRAYKIKAPGFDEARLKQAYKDLGYNDADADLLVEFTRQDVGEEAKQERELITGPVRTQALNMYRARRITEAELRKTLSSLGYGQDVTDRYVREIEFTRAVEQREDVAAALKSAYVKGLRSRDDTRTLLIQGGWPDDAVEDVLGPWDLLRQATELQPHQAAQRDLTQAQLVAAYADALLDRTEAFNRLLALGYDDTEAETLLALQDYKTTQEDLKARVENVRLNFLRYAYSEAEASTELTKLGLPVLRVRNLVMQYAREREKQTPDFSIATLEGMVKTGVMPEDVAAGYLERQGFLPEQRFYLLNWWLGRRQPRD